MINNSWHCLEMSSVMWANCWKICCHVVFRARIPVIKISIPYTKSVTSGESVTAVHCSNIATEIHIKGLVVISHKMAGSETHYSPPSSATAKMAWSRTSIPPYTFVAYWLVNNNHLLHPSCSTSTLKHRQISTGLHDATTQKTTIFRCARVPNWMAKEWEVKNF
jgi:hypothetical protein